MLISYQYRLFSVMCSVCSFILFLPDHGFLRTDDVFLFYLKIGTSLTVRSFVQISMSDLFLGEASLPDLYKKIIGQPDRNSRKVLIFSLNKNHSKGAKIALCESWYGKLFL